MSNNKSRASKKFIKCSQSVLSEIIAKTQITTQPQIQPRIQEQTLHNTVFLHQPDSLTTLLQKARSALTNRQLLKQQSKDTSRPAFLTAIELTKKQFLPPQKQENLQSEVLDEQVTNLLKKRTLQDELQELRKEIKQTGMSLGSYSRQVLETKDEVVKLGWRYGSAFRMDSLDLGSTGSESPPLRSYLEAKRSKRNFPAQNI